MTVTVLPRAEETCCPTLILAGPFSCRLSCVERRRALFSTCFRALFSTCIRLMVIIFFGGMAKGFGISGAKYE